MSISLSERFLLGAASREPNHTAASQKKADVVEHPQVFDHVGLLVNGPSGTAGLPFI